jgi:hypothetical protein
MKNGWPVGPTRLAFGRHHPQGVALGWKNRRPIGAKKGQKPETAILTLGGAFLLARSNIPYRVRREKPVALLSITRLMGRLG